MRRGKLITCALCDRQREHGARALCCTCYKREWYAGRLGDHERIYWPRDLLLEEWDRLAAEGYTRQQAADRLGITKGRLEKAIARERAAQRQGAV